MKIEVLVKAAPRKHSKEVYFELYSSRTPLEKCNKFECDIEYRPTGGGEYFGELRGSIVDGLKHLAEPIEMKIVLKGGEV